jgi:3-oxoacyl-[acyl-carrier-protein] synthase II
MINKVVVTGMGAVSPVGNSVDEFTEAIFGGRSGAAAVTRFDASHLPTKFAAEVKNFNSEIRDVKVSFAIAAVREAVAQAFGKNFDFKQTRASLSIGLGLELFDLEDLLLFYEKKIPEFKNWRDRLLFLNTPSDLCIPLICREFNLTHPPLTHISACAASTDAIGSAFMALRSGAMDVVVAGGADSMINPMGLAGFCRIGALSTKNDSPNTASKPFDKSRDGFLLGEGAGFLVLETENHAKKRGAKILASISGYGNSMDAYSISDPHPEGAGALAAMKKALVSANLSSTDISAVSAHGTSTPKNDPAEATSLRNLLGERATKIPVFATKSMIGHLISAGGAVETIAAIQCLRFQKVHHTANLKDVDPRCQLKHVMERSMDMELQHILKNSFAFGGQNACLVISRGDHNVA